VVCDHDGFHSAISLDVCVQNHGLVRQILFFISRSLYTNAGFPGRISRPVSQVYFHCNLIFACLPLWHGSRAFSVMGEEDIPEVRTEWGDALNVTVDLSPEEQKRVMAMWTNSSFNHTGKIRPTFIPLIDWISDFVFSRLK